MAGMWCDMAHQCCCNLFGAWAVADCQCYIGAWQYGEGVRILVLTLFCLFYGYVLEKITAASL